uniref:Uncharacterized protein n=1 Tax=viral metagenome TaxID=1070528 RepID=A0A6C0JB88_9ZZZZ
MKWGGIDGLITGHAWFMNGKRHRRDGPALIEWAGKRSSDTNTNKIDRECWYVNDKKHNMDGPATTMWLDGIKIRESWYFDGKRHRLDNPAITCWSYPDRVITSIHMYVDNERHSLADPAEIEWTEGIKTYEVWCNRGKLHRSDGPALSYWVDDIILI